MYTTGLVPAKLGSISLLSYPSSRSEQSVRLVSSELLARLLAHGPFATGILPCKAWLIRIVLSVRRSFY